MSTVDRDLARLAAALAEGKGTKVGGVNWVFQPKPPNIELRDKLREKRKRTKLETARKRGLLRE